MNLKPLSFLLFAVFLLAACDPATSAQPAPVTGKEVAVAGGSYTDVSPAELQTMLAQKDFVFVNVHIPFAGDLPQTDLSIPFDQIAQHLDQIPAEKDAKIVLYCSSGNMSGQAAKTLIELGYTNVWNLTGGFTAWKAAGLPMAGK